MQSEVPVVNVAYQNKQDFFNDLYYRLFDYISQETFWTNNCIFCFLVSKYSEKDKDIDYGHPSVSCFEPSVIPFISCATCFGNTQHQGSVFCRQKLLPKKTTGLCSYCWLPMKIGPNWVHKEPSVFGVSDCPIPHFTGRLLFLLRKRILNNCKVTAQLSLQDYAEWLAEDSNDPDWYGLSNSVVALSFALGSAQKLLEDSF